MYSDAVEKALKAARIKIGDKIKVRTVKEEFEGILMPRPEQGDSNIIVVKLGSGYNVGVKYVPGVRIEIISSHTETQQSTRIKKAADKSLEKVTILFTGGTIGSKVDYTTGGVITTAEPGEIINDVPELSEIANIEARDIMHRMSEDLTYKDWQDMAEATADAFKRGARGVVITMGTDMMHYASAALSFMIKNPSGPVVITGAQRSMDRGSSDAFMNLTCATQVAAKGNFREVGVCMHEKSSDDSCSFIRGTKVRKMHTSRRDAFRAINSSPLASVTLGGDIRYAPGYRPAASNKNEPMRLEPGYEPRVALVKSYPHADPGIIDYYRDKGYKGLIIEGTGLGHTPISSPYDWPMHIKWACDSGMIIGMTSQCLYGRVNPTVYVNLRLVSNAGAIYCEDMLPEVAYIKLGWLLGNHDRNYAKEWLPRNMVGEITPRTEFEWFDA